MRVVFFYISNQLNMQQTLLAMILKLSRWWWGFARIVYLQVFFFKKVFLYFLDNCFSLFFSSLSVLPLHLFFLLFSPLPFWGGNLPFFLLNLSYSKAITEASRISVWMILTTSASFCVLHLIGKNKRGKKCCSSSCFHGNVPPLTFQYKANCPQSPCMTLETSEMCYVATQPEMRVEKSENCGSLTKVGRVMSVPIFLNWNVFSLIFARYITSL